MSAVILTGDPVCGFSVIGPFDHAHMAQDYAVTAGLGTGWWVAAVDAPDVDDEVRVSLPVQAIATVVDGEVVKVNLLPAQSEAAFSHWSGRDDLSDAAIKVAATTVWKPLLGLPANVVWEG